MNHYHIPTPVYIAIGERPPSNVGTVHADNHGRVNPEEIGSFLMACGDHILTRTSEERQRRRETPGATADVDNGHDSGHNSGPDHAQ